MFENLNRSGQIFVECEGVDIRGTLDDVKCAFAETLENLSLQRVYAISLSLCTAARVLLQGWQLFLKRLNVFIA